MALSPTSSRGGSSTGPPAAFVNSIERTTSVTGGSTILTSAAFVTTLNQIVLVALYCAYFQNDGATAAGRVDIFVDGSSRGTMGYVYAPAVNGQRQGVTLTRLFQDFTAGSHTVRADLVGAGATMFAGAGTSAGDSPIQLVVYTFSVAS
jgi:hypothetical protein